MHRHERRGDDLKSISKLLERDSQKMSSCLWRQLNSRACRYQRNQIPILVLKKRRNGLISLLTDISSSWSGLKTFAEDKLNTTETADFVEVCS